MQRPRPLLRWLLGRRQAAPGDLPPGARLSADLSYGEDPAQVLDVHHPVTRPSGPVLVLVHGGGWRRGDKAAGPVVGHKVAHWGGQGWIVVSVGYRLWPAADPLEQAADLARAISFVQRHVAAWGGDPAQMALLGHSSGGHVAALLVADPSLAATHGARPWAATVVVDTAALDVPALMQGRHLPQHEQVFGTEAAAWPLWSPLHRLSKAPDGAVLLVCSTRRDDSVAASDAFAARLQAIGGRVQTLGVALGHLQLNSELGHDPAYTAAVDNFLRGAGLAGGETPAGTRGPGT